MLNSMLSPYPREAFDTTYAKASPGGILKYQQLALVALLVVE